MDENYSYGPFRNDDPASNVTPYRRTARELNVDHQRFRREIVEHFTRRQQRLRVVKTTATPRGLVLDWIPVESQRPGGSIASPPPPLPRIETAIASQPESRAIAELERDNCERGPEGTVPIVRKKLDALGYTVPLRQYLSKYRGVPAANVRGVGVLVPGPGSRGTHWTARVGQRGICFGGDADFSCFDPFTDSSDEFSLIQIGMSNSDLGFLQTVEAGWQEFRDQLGDWVPHLFTYYTTNGYAHDDDNEGGYNTDVDGWVQHDNVIFPGTTFTPYSVLGGEQRKISLKYQWYQDNWWLSCQGRWVGYYPGHLFMGNQSEFSTLGDHADHVGFWGEVARFGDAPTKTDMGSGRFAEEGWTRAAYFHNLRVQVGRNGEMAEFDGGEVSSTDKSLYDIDAHIHSGTSWGSYAYVGGPGAG